MSAADDLVQDTVERAWSRLHLYSADTGMRAWLYTIMHNIHIKSVRHARRSGTVEADPADLAEAPPQADGPLLWDLERAMETLGDEHREVLLLLRLEGLSYDQVARMLDIPVGTVMSRLSRAREKLRINMGGRGPTKLKVVK
jgi:RNA polymerase sigma factor (sigma-70 family)